MPDNRQNPSPRRRINLSQSDDHPNILKYRSEYRHAEIKRLEKLEKTQGLTFSQKGTLETLRRLVMPIKQP